MENEYEKRGDEVAIFLNRRDGIMLETIINLHDLDIVKAFDGKWYATTKKSINHFYVNGICRANHKTIYLHRFITKAPSGLVVDHIDQDTLNNRQNNLRIVKHSENMQNRKVHKNCKSGIRGVYWHKGHQLWGASIQVNGRRIYRYFKTIEEAEIFVIETRKEIMKFSS